MSAIMTATPTFDQVVEAARRIESGIIRTPCVRSAALSELCDANVWCKLDYQQSTGSFKERGGRNALMQLDAATRAKGVIAASALLASGNKMAQTEKIAAVSSPNTFSSFPISFAASKTMLLFIKNNSNAI